LGNSAIILAVRIAGLRVVVTGGAGFIGSHLVSQLLATRNQVVVLDDFSSGRRENLDASRALEVVAGDVRDLSLLQRVMAGAQVVFHLAVRCVRLSLDEPGENHEVNASGTLNALRAARGAGVQRFVYCSSSEVYGDVQRLGDAGLSEDSPKEPTTIYGASKLAGELYTLAYQKTYGLPACVVRPFNAYGPRAHYEGAFGEVIPRFALWISAGLPPVIFGDGTQTRDFTFVEDTAAGLLAAAECDELLGDSLNLAHGEEIAIDTIARLICELRGVTYAPKRIAARPGDIQRLGATPAKSRRLLGELAPTPIREGLRRYLRWLDAQRLDYRALADALEEQNWCAASLPSLRG
jgi:UDP-glucose 4-epimerase